MICYETEEVICRGHLEARTTLSTVARLNCQRTLTLLVYHFSDVMGKSIRYNLSPQTAQYKCINYLTKQRVRLSPTYHINIVCMYF